MEKQIYNHEQEFNKLYQERIINNKGLSEANKTALIDFFTLLEAENLSYARRKKLLLFLGQILIWLNKDLVKCTKEDLIALVATINKQEYADWTARDYKIITKKAIQTLSTLDKYKCLEPLYFWLYDKRNKYYSCSIDKKNAALDKDWFTDEDVKKIINAASNTRDKCFFNIIASQGMRPEEILTLKTKDVIKIENGIQIKISKGKTGQRTVFVYEGHVINSILEYLLQKENEAKNNKDRVKKGGDDYLFDFKLRNAQKILKNLATKAGITKRAYLYKFRKFAVTQDRIRGVSTGGLEAKYGWIKGTEVIGHYDKSISTDYQKEMQAKFGIIKNDEKRTGFEEKTCARCGQKCAYNLEYCTKCGLNLSITHEELMKNTNNTQKENQELKSRIDKLEKVFECLVGNPEIKKIVSRPDFIQ